MTPLTLNFRRTQFIWAINKFMCQHAHTHTHTHQVLLFHSKLIGNFLLRPILLTVYTICASFSVCRKNRWHEEVLTSHCALLSKMRCAPVSFVHTYVSIHTYIYLWASFSVNEMFVCFFMHENIPPGSRNECEVTRDRKSDTEQAGAKERWRWRLRYREKIPCERAKKRRRENESTTFMCATI